MAKVLVVEDEALIRFALADELVDAGHTVIECSNVLEAVAAIATHDDINAVVTDVDMPGGSNGLELARMMLITRPSVPVWVTSGRDVNLSQIEGYLTFVAKPYDLAALCDQISRRTVGEISRGRPAVAARSSRFDRAK